MPSATETPGSRLRLQPVPLALRWLLAPASTPRSGASPPKTTACDPYEKRQASRCVHARGELRTFTINGLIRQKDISGLGVHAQAQKSIVPDLYHNHVPNPMLQRLVARGQTGLDAGRGFYDWSTCDVEGIRYWSSAKLERLMNQISGLDLGDGSNDQIRPQNTRQD